MRRIRPRHVGLVFALSALTPACARSNGGARAQSHGAPTDATLPAVTVIPVREGTLDRRITLPGTIRAYQEATLYAKVGGYLESIAVDLIPAATASSSASSSAVVTISDFSRVRVEVAMPQAEVALVKAGLPATLTVRELAGRTFEGAVTRIAYALDDSTKTMGAEIELPNTDGALRPGMYASVEISVERKSGALLVPAQALVTEKGKPFAFTVAANKAHKVALRLGLDDGVNVEVVDGLAANALVVVSGAQSLTDGQACRPVEAK